MVKWWILRVWITSPRTRGSEYRDATHLRKIIFIMFKLKERDRPFWHSEQKDNFKVRLRGRRLLFYTKQLHLFSFSQPFPHSLTGSLTLCFTRNVPKCFVFPKKRVEADIEVCKLEFPLLQLVNSRLETRMGNCAYKLWYITGSSTTVLHTWDIRSNVFPTSTTRYFTRKLRSIE